MNEKNNKSLHERVAQLEATVADLQAKIKQKSDVSEQKKIREVHPLLNDSNLEWSSSVKQTPNSPEISNKSFEFPEYMRKSEYWLNKFGIGLLLFGVAFLFKYSIDQGWLTPPVRIGFGIFLGIILIGAGIRISNNRRHFSQVLIGGGIATFYITGFAAFQVFNLISHPVAFAFMILITLLAFILSLKLDGIVLAMIGIIGGLSTPFLLYTGTSNLTGLIAYTCIVLSGTSAIYFYRGWRSILWTSVVGGWIVFLIGLNKGLSTDIKESISDRWALQSGIIFGWIAFWMLPLIREMVSIENPQRWPQHSVDFTEKYISQDVRNFLKHHVHLLSVFTPLIVLKTSMATWSLPDETWGWITLGGAIIYGLTYWRLFHQKVFENLAYTHFLVGIMLLTIALYLQLDGNLLLFALVNEAFILYLIARRLQDKVVVIAAHVLFGIVGMWLIQRLFHSQSEGLAILNIKALTDLWSICLASIASVLFIFSKHKKVYLIIIHIFIMGWLLRELLTLPHGQGYVTIAWGAYGVILLIFSLRKNLNYLLITAMITLIIVVGKLFLVDLVKLETIWRVILFIGFGGLFLILSYYYKTIWKSNKGR